MTLKNLSNIIFVGLLFCAQISFADSIFKEVTKDSGLPLGEQYSFIMGDFDNDGLVDILTTNALFKNTTQNHKISFQDITESSGLKALLKGNTNPTVADFNNDGRLDIVTLNNLLLIQDSSGHFVDRAKEFELEIPEDTHTLSVGDFNKVREAL